jgi:hypothetical protein
MPPARPSGIGRLTPSHKFLGFAVRRDVRLFVASCGVDSAVEPEEWQECRFFLFLAALPFLRARGAAYVLSRSRGLGYVLSSSTCCVPLQTSGSVNARSILWRPTFARASDAARRETMQHSKKMHKYVTYRCNISLSRCPMTVMRPDSSSAGKSV